MILMKWTLEDQLDWELIREAPEDIASEVAARRPDLVKLCEDACFALKNSGGES